MATKAERFKAAVQRSAHAPRKKKEDRRGGGNSTAQRNVSKHAARKAVYALEESRAENGRPSRKSTRKSANRVKHDELHVKAAMRAQAPAAQAARTTPGRRRRSPTPVR